METWSQEDVLALVSAVYDAALDPRLWPDFLKRLCTVAGGASALLLQRDSQGQQQILAAAEIDVAFQRSYIHYYRHRNVWLAGVRRPMPDQARTSEMTLPAAQLVRTEFYQDFLRPQQVLHSVAACIKTDRLSTPFCTLFRSPRQGPFDPAQMDLLTTLTPHLRRALEMQDRTALFQVQSAAALAALDTIHFGCLLVDKTARVLLANRAAEAILDACDGLATCAGVLAAARLDQQERMREFIHSAAATVDGHGLKSGGALAVARPSGAPALHVLVIPFRAPAGPGPRPAALVFIADPQRELRPDHEVLAAVFGLTPGESRVAAVLLDGRGIERCAEQLAISRHTARNHLKAIFSKTGTTRQGELVRLLLNSVARLKSPE